MGVFFSIYKPLFGPFSLLLRDFFPSFMITTCYHSNDDATQITLSQHVHDMTLWQRLIVQCGCTSVVNVEQYIAQSSLLPSHGTIFCTNQNIVK